MSSEVNGLPLERGAAGEAVRDLQHRLISRGHAVDPAELGVFATSTEAAVSAFQQACGLRPNGRCDDATWSSLVEAGYRLGDRLLYLRTPMQRGDDVAQLQRRLGSLGFDAGRVDGIFGPDTERAVREFQRNAGLAADGIFGPDTDRAFGRLGNRVEQDVMVAGVRERQRLRDRPDTLAGHRVAVGEPGGLGALARAVRHRLAAHGAEVVVLTHATSSGLAAEANAFAADVYLGLGIDDQSDGCVAYYRTEGFESLGGHGLADAVVAELSGTLDAPMAEPMGLRLPILRETRMPAVVCLLGSAEEAVIRAEEIADGLSRALDRWVQQPRTP
ncbi:MAG: peptidoglycan-binding protein [Acidimicrobiales bacterium]